MAKNDPLIGDINRSKFDPGDFNLENSGTPGNFFWTSEYTDPDTGFTYDPQTSGLIYGDVGAGEGMLNTGGLNSNWITDFAGFGYDQFEAQDIMDNAGFATFYNSFFDSGTWNANPVEWWKDYGAYLSPYDNTQETLAKRKGNIQTENLRREALDTIDKMGGFSGKRGFAGDSGMENAQKSLMEDSIRQNEMQTLGVNASLWDIKDNYMSNLYSQFGQLAQVGAFDGMGD